MKSVIVFKNRQINGNFESRWLPMQLSKRENFGVQANSSSLQIVWKNITGVTDGFITIVVSNDAENETQSSQFIIDSMDNSNDALMIIFPPYFKYFKLKVTANSISGGEISAILYYDEK